MVGGRLAHLRDRLLHRLRPVHLVRSDRHWRRRVGYADAAAGEEERRARNPAATLLIADIEPEIAVQPEREDRSDAVLLVLEQLRQYVLARVRGRAVLASGDESDMSMRIDHPRHDGASAHVDDARSFRSTQLSDGADVANPIASHDHHAVLTWRASCAVDQ